MSAGTKAKRAVQYGVPVIGWIWLIVENRRAVKRGKQKPHQPAKIAQEVLQSAADIYRAVKR